MSNLTSLSEENPRGIIKSHPDLDTFKSVFYWANAKPDTQIKAFGEKKRINLADIRSLKEQVDNKLKLHHIENYISTINFLLSEGNIRDYGAWAEFERENWSSINLRTKAINIAWDMTILLPGYQIPQRHTLKLRIGDSMPPKDMFQLMFTSDDTIEITAANAAAICKVDFVNQVLANELLILVENWYKSLHKVQKSIGLQKFLISEQKFILACISNFTPVILFGIYTLYYSLLCKKEIFASEVDLMTLQTTLVVGIFIFTVGIMLGRYFARITELKIDKFKSYTGFSISRGDELYNAEIKEENRNNRRSIVKKSILALVIGLVIAVFRVLLEKWIK